MSRNWTFLTHHAHVLLALREDPSKTIDELARVVGVTTRSIVNVLNDLEEGGYLTKHRNGRNNQYEINETAALRHSTSRDHTVGELLQALGQLQR